MPVVVPIIYVPHAISPTHGAPRLRPLTACLSSSAAAAARTGQPESEFNSKGREITAEGQRDLDRIAGSL